MRFGLGIDAGGTYTDSVIIDLDTGNVLCWNKSLTTHDDLVVGIRNSLDGLDHDLLRSVTLSALSSTLATNSVVENKGCRVGLICIGAKYAGTSPDCYAEVKGKFSFSGKEEVSLDMNSVKQALSDMKGKVDAVAVSGYISVRNPSHENTVSELAKRILNVPTVCAHELTSQLGFEQRTTTAIMNARLIPVISNLLQSVKSVLSEFEIRSPLMVIKGNGSMMKSDIASAKPVETILSGPASSLMGAKALTGKNDAMVIDIGGTTSDIGILNNGFPKVDPEGAFIEGKRTRVLAANMSTYGIGGDSRIIVNGKELFIATTRVVPLCIASEKWPSVRSTIAALENITEDTSVENYALGEIIQSTEFFVLGQCKETDSLNECDRRLLDLAKDNPIRISDAATQLGVGTHAFSVSEMESRGYLVRIGVTPTDILHAEGIFTQYDEKTSATAIGFLARKCGKTPQEFIRYAKEQICRKIASKAAEKAIMNETGSEALSQSDRDLIDRIFHQGTSGYSVAFKLNYPIIGIGAPVNAWLPRVAELLNTQLILHKHSNIGNAIGAITSTVQESVSITIRAGKELVENPECNVFTGKEVRTFDCPSEAMEYARCIGIQLATESASRSGTKNPVIDVQVEEDFMTLSETRKLFRGATVTVTATGKPDLT